MSFKIPAPVDHECPKCGVAMEPIDVGVDGLPIQGVELCPRCYLVMWTDKNGLHSRQGVPMKKGFTPEGDSETESTPQIRKPEEC